MCTCCQLLKSNLLTSLESTQGLLKICNYITETYSKKDIKLNYVTGNYFADIKTLFNTM